MCQWPGTPSEEERFFSRNGIGDQRGPGARGDTWREAAELMDKWSKRMKTSEPQSKDFK